MYYMYICIVGAHMIHTPCGKWERESDRLSEREGEGPKAICISFGTIDKWFIGSASESKSVQSTDR